MSELVIAIDGPAGAGKSTVAKMLANRLGLRYLDTGAMYRALALKAARLGIGPAEGERIAVIGRETCIEFGDGDPQRVILDGQEVTSEIRTQEIAELASAISAHSPVRRVMVEKQQAIVRLGGVTLEGRDATTVIAPEADVKVFLTASIEERARRRFAELAAKGDPTTFEEVLRQVAARDHRDYTREDSPLTVAEGAIVIESFGIPPEVVVEKILGALRSWTP